LDEIFNKNKIKKIIIIRLVQVSTEVSTELKISDNNDDIEDYYVANIFATKLKQPKIKPK